MATILILGAGVMGSAFSFPLTDAGHTVRLVGTHLDSGWIKEVRATGVHPKLKLKLADSVIPYTHDQLGEALNELPDMIVFGVNSVGVNWAVQQLGPLLKAPIPILMLTKGLAVCDDSFTILPDVVRLGLANYGVKNVPVGAVGGPCIAGELGAKRDTSVIIAYSDEQLFNRISPLIKAPYYHVRSSTDIIGVEVCAALKNFFALAVGYPDGLLEKQGQSSNGVFMYNLSAGLFSQALVEMSYLVSFMGGNNASVYDLPGVGDLYVTCQAGRNSRMGCLLGTGLRYSEVKASHMANETVEGAELALIIGPLLERLFTQGLLKRAALPLTAAIINAICHDSTLQIPWAQFDKE